MTPAKTQCPHCNSLFQVTQQQLEIANGTVRCGNCLNIFQAEDHFVGNQGSFISPASLYEQSGINRQIEEVDESWALELLKELEAEDVANQPESPVSQKDHKTLQANPEKSPELPVLQNSPVSAETRIETLSDAFRNLASDSGQNHFGVYDTPLATDEPRIDDESWTKAILKENAAPAPVNNQSAAPAHKPAAEKSTPSIHPLGMGEELSAFRENVSRKNSPAAAKDYVSALEIEPISLDLGAGSARKFLHQLSSFLLVILAALALGFQYLSYNMDSLARNTLLRPYYSEACKILACRLPLLSDITAIRGKNLVVRSHPNQAEALRVDLIITNHADFPQDFPLLELTFSDVNGFPVARRRFKPTEYLSGALGKLDFLPVKTPLHISLGILDPGQNAVNYYVTFHENSSKKS